MLLKGAQNCSLCNFCHSSLRRSRLKFLLLFYVPAESLLWGKKSENQFGLASVADPNWEGGANQCHVHVIAQIRIICGTAAYGQLIGSGCRRCAPSCRRRRLLVF